ncbi:MAG: UvrD-helicase domain-containing protein, partial [Myxococcota bacterium]|nr:UvrD-helicase domain-containing protein [Myxococcota bacterium]
ERAQQGRAPAEEGHAVVPVLLASLPNPERRAAGIGHLRRAIEGFDEAQISTIHGFCRQALRENTFETGAPFDAEMVETIRPLLEELTHDGWTRERHDADPELLAHLHDRKVTHDTFFKLARAVAASPESPRVPPGPGQLVPLSTSVDEWTAARRGFRQRWRAEGDAVISTLREAVERDELNKTRYKPEALANKRRELEAWLDSEHPSALGAEVLAPFGTEVLTSALIKKFARAGGSVTHPLLSDVDALMDACRVACASLDQLGLGLLHRFAGFILEQLTARKRARRILAYDDLLGLLRDRVTGPDANPTLVRALQARYDVALIDEFQDTDPVQWGIFEAVFATAGRRLIVVGDPKQAIYAFRGADIHTYLAARSHPDMSVAQLGTNHRSDEAVVDGVGHIFTNPRVDDPFVNRAIAYGDVTARHTERRFWSGDGTPPGVVISHLRREAAGVDSRKGIPTSRSPLPPRLTASQIVAFLASGAELEDQGTRRAVRPSDIAVLVRSNQNARDVQRALRTVGVPSTLRHDSTVFESDEARELVRVLEAVLEPRRAGQVRRALCTRLLGQDIATLAALQTDEAGWTDWMERLGQWRRRWFLKGFATFARTLTTTPLPVPGADEPMTLPTRLLGWRDGERRFTNLNHLLERLHEAASSDDLAPSALVEWLKRKRTEKADKEDERGQLRLESDGDAVTISTVHKSKGLQYAFVWCPYLWATTEVGPRQRLPLRFRDPDHGQRWSLDLDLDLWSESKRAHVALANRTNLGDATRQLYVALTRAKHQVHLLHGPMNGLGCSALGHLLHPGEPTPERLDDDALFERLRVLAEGSDGTIALRDIPTLPDLAFHPRRAEESVDLRARRFERSTPIDGWWRRTSFSGLTSQKQADEEPIQDHDPEPEEDESLRDDEQSPGAVTAEPGHDDRRSLGLVAFKGGTRAGSCLHTVYERHDFQRPELLEGLVAEQLEAFGFDAAAWSQPVSAAIQTSLDTPLGLSPDLRLGELPMGRRFDEIDFVFPLRADGGAVVSAKDVSALMAAHPGPGMPSGYPARLQRLGFLPVRGFMVGSIDLVFEHDGRWYVVDYKSNNLGPHPADYTPSHLAEAMSHSHYVLQYHIYCVALHRYLRWRLGARYRFADHFGGVLYLFMRGMAPDHAPGTGIFRDEPPEALVEGLSHLLGGDR